MAIYALCGLHALCLCIAIYQRVHIGIHCHIELFRGGKQVTSIDGQAEDCCTRFARTCCCCIYPLLKRCCSSTPEEEASKADVEEMCTQTDSKGLYLNGPNLPKLPVNGEDGSDDGGAGVGGTVSWGHSAEIEVQTDPMTIAVHGARGSQTPNWSDCNQESFLDPVVVDARIAHTDTCFAYYYNYPAIGSSFSGPWRCAKNKFYNGVAVQIEFDGAHQDWEPMGYRADVWGRIVYKKVELVALIEETSVLRPPEELLKVDKENNTRELVPGGGKYNLDDPMDKKKRVCYVCSYHAEDDSLVVSRGYSHASGGHMPGKRWRLVRVPHLFGTPQVRRTDFCGAWQCERNDFYQGRVVEIEPDGDTHRWHPRGGALANYTKVDLIDLVETMLDEDKSYRKSSNDDGGKPLQIEQHHVCSLSSSGHTLTASRAYTDDGHSGELWTLNRIRDCGGESLQTQLYARTYKYVHASAGSNSAFSDATTALQQLQSIEFNGAREMATKRSKLGVAQAWSVEHTDAVILRRNMEILDTVASILRRFPELVCEVHGTTTTPRDIDKDLGDFFFQRDKELGRNFFKLDSNAQMQRVYACLARERAAACLAALVERGVEVRRMRTTHQACTGESKVHFIARSAFRTTASYDPSDDADFIFASFDADNSGSIDVQELRVCLNELGLRTDTRGAAAILKAFDDDKSARLEFHEFKRMVHKLRSYYARLAARYDPKDEIDQVFMAFDKDGNGEMDVVELRDACNYLKLATDSDDARRILVRYDRRRTGTLDHKEFRRLVEEIRRFMALPPKPAGAPKQLSVGQVFRSFDKDGSGDIDVAELGPALNALGLSADSEEAAMVMKKYDVDNSGKLSLAEFRVLAKELREFQLASGGAPPTPKPPPGVDKPAGGESVGGVFRRFDKDNSGAIDLSELIQALNALGLQSDEAGTAAVMAKYDKDGNGTLELPEFRLLVTELKQFQKATSGGAATPAAAPKPSNSVGGVFRRFDADQSGAIDAGELLQALNALGLQSDEAGTAAVLAKYDKDGNGTLSLDEFRLLVKELKAYQQQSA